MVESLPAAIQIVIAAVGAYSIAHFAVGHPAPLIAVTVTITTLGINRDARPRKVLETSIGITVGIAVSELIVISVGRGAWQLSLVLLATLLVARAISANPAFAIAAAVQSSLVVLLPEPEGGVFTRSLDGLIAGAMALAVTALFPRDPRREAARDAHVLFSVFSEALAGTVDALRGGDHQAAELALERLRRTQVLVDNWTASLDTATSIAHISPWIHRQLPELEMQSRVLKAADLTARHLRTVTRRVATVTADGKPRPELADLIAELANGISLLGQQVDDRDLTGASRSVFEDLARRLDPDAIMTDPELRETLIVVLLRPLIVDLLAASGMSSDDAKSLLPPI